MRRIATLALPAALVSVLAVGLWFRVSSLESMPYPDGDESWYLIQLNNALYGKPFHAFTMNGNPLNPFFVLLHVPLLVTADPAFWHLRLIPLTCGIAAVAAAYLLGRRVLDRPSALIAAVGLAVLPVGIIYSRIAFDACQTPLISVVMLYFAFRGNGVGLLLSFLAAYIIHPTNLFLVPVTLPVLLVRQLERNAGDRRRQVVTAAVTVSVAAVVTLAIGLFVMRHGTTAKMYNRSNGPSMGYHDWRLFLDVYRRTLLGIWIDASAEVRRWNNLAFWGAVASVLTLGSAQLLRQRQWTRLALIAGTVASVTGFYIVCGARAIEVHNILCLRYGMFLVVPTVFSLACAAYALRVEPTTRPRAVLLGVQRAGLIGVAAALLVCTKVNWYDRCHDGIPESIWTFKVDAKNPFRQAATTLGRVTDRSDLRADKKLVITDNFWTHYPLAYLMLRRPDIEITSCDEWMMNDGVKVAKAVAEQMEQGAYVSVLPGDWLDSVVKSQFPPERLDIWTNTNARGAGPTLYRLKGMSAIRPAELERVIAERASGRVVR
jgi:hypothetical protein